MTVARLLDGSASLKLQILSKGKIRGFTNQVVGLWRELARK
jgi:hypothetical protein